MHVWQSITHLLLGRRLSLGRKREIIFRLIAQIGFTTPIHYASTQRRCAAAALTGGTALEQLICVCRDSLLPPSKISHMATQRDPALLTACL
ncbi:unnamed protein product [Toxocara canis]|uniref:Secreted protein n=1 Tax=Toxocara canis TaxID=6265 RepID=A0A183UE13_TOXCA|nr:unnamed protein product [Toxocara canis]